MRGSGRVRGRVARERWRRWVGLLSAALALTVALAGCGGSGGASNAGGSGQGTAAGSGAPQNGGTVTIPIVADPTFNPWHPNAYVESVFVNRVLFDGLTKPGKDLSPAPDLATSWEPSKDGLSWTFHLRQGVQWHDGQPFTADDVAFTFDQIVLNPKLAANGASYFKAVKDVVAVDPSTVVFHLNRPFAALPAYLAYNAGILPKHIFEGKDPWTLASFNKEHPVGTGPFMLQSYTPGQDVVLVRNPDYFGGAPHLDKLVFKILPDPNAQLAQALSNEITIFTLDDKSAVDRVKAAKNLVIRPETQVQFYWLALNQANPLFTDVRVRQAILYAIDRKAIIASVEKGYATVANAPISPALKKYYDPSLAGLYPYDPAKARQLLAEAGWTQTNADGVLVKDGKPFHFVLDVGLKGDVLPVSQLVQQYLRKVGIDAQLNSMEWNAFIQKDVVQRSYDATINWWVYPADPDVLPFFISSAAGKGNNIPGYKDAKLDQLLVAGEQTSDPQARVEVYRRLQQYMAQTLPYVFLWFPQEVQVRNVRLHGVPDLGLRDAMEYVNEWWLSK
ncbi:MAG: ABC transporter substrate-binding protein [Firmicutes bacterium]|nr:ABC transporter substrate-binding protein [Bacillota bacterium]